MAPAVAGDGSGRRRHARRAAQDLREQAAEGAIRASGIAADVTLTDPDSGETTDAVQVELDHADADAVDVYVPVREPREGGIKFGELVAAEGREPVFAASARSARQRLPCGGSFAGAGRGGGRRDRVLVRGPERPDDAPGRAAGPAAQQPLDPLALLPADVRAARVELPRSAAPGRAGSERSHSKKMSRTSPRR